MYNIDLIHKFIDSRIVMGCTSKTVSDYRYFLLHYSKWCDSVDIAIDSVETFNTYILYLLDKSLSRVSVRTYLAHVRAYYHWLSDRGYININLSDLKLPLSSKKIIEPLTGEEVKHILNCYAESDVLSIRNRLIVSLMLDCGFRISDCLDLKVNNVKDNYFVVTGKGSKMRIVPYGQNVKNLISEYRTARPSAGVTLILTNRNDPITSDCIKMMFQKLKAKSGVKRVHAHLLRHTFATNYLLNGGNLEKLRLIMGHEDISVTQIYLHMAEVSSLMTDKHISYLDLNM